ncbi:MAG TPA: DUF4864 domain-containing protein [Devosia sp.]|nr:DUF4864 domain-containing protein [Devosia sp.]
MARLAWFGILVPLVALAWPVAADDTSSASSAPASSAPEASTPPPPAVAPTVDPAEAANWQAVIDGQVQAFRDHNGSVALSFASAAFQGEFTDPAAFLAAIIGSGYGPIADSRSDSFGPYQYFAPDTVYQDVKFIDNDQTLYEAIYALTKEPGGWRVAGVQMAKTPGVGA